MKICKLCKLPKEKFSINRHGNESSVCQQCRNKQLNDYKYRNRNYWMLTCAKHRAKVAGLPFNITREDVVIPEYCPALGIKLEGGTRQDHDASPSLDRIIPDLGYVKGNVVVISHKANRIKTDATAEELRKLADWLEKREASPA